MSQPPSTVLVISDATTTRPTVPWHSQSSCREYERCPRRYRFAYVDRAPTARRAPAHWRFGTVVHAGLEAAFRTAQATGRPVREAVAEAVEGLRASWIEEAMPAEEFDRAEALVRRSVEAQNLRDHKVTRHRRGPQQLFTDRQLNLYAWMARHRWPWARAVYASHHYPLLDEVVRARLRPARMDAVVAAIDALATKIAADTEFAATPGSHCGHCLWSHRCPDAEKPGVAA